MLSEEEYEKAKKVAKEIYSRIGPIYCPLLEDYVHFTSKGFDHLINKGRIPRPRAQQLKRFKCISFLPEIVSNPKADITFNDTRGIKFWTLTTRIGSLKIRVIVNQPSKNKDFVSIYPVDMDNKKPHYK